MRSKGDELRRLYYYAEHGRENPDAAAQMSLHYVELSKLMTDDLSREVFNIAYIRITSRYTGGDFVKQFTRLFTYTLREIRIKKLSYENKRTTYDGIYQQAEEDEY